MSSTTVEPVIDIFRHRPQVLIASTPQFQQFTGLQMFGMRIALASVIMLRISTIDTRSERRLVVEGKLIQPWLEEFRKALVSAAQDLQGRKVVVDLSNTTVISAEGESVIFELMREGARFACGGVLTRHVLKRLARRWHSRTANPSQSHD